MPQHRLQTVGEVTVRPHPRREAVTQKLPRQVSWLSGYRIEFNFDSSIESRLPINVFDSGFVVNQLPGHSGATAAGSHRLPFYSQRFINVLETEEPSIFV